MEGRGRRVAITGYGVVAPCGLGKDAFWQGLLGPAITDAKAIFIENWDPSAYYASPKESRRADAVEQFAMASATEAFEHAGKIDVDPRRFGIIYGTGIGGLRTLEEQIELRLEKGERRVSPFLVPMMMGNASGAAISMRYGLQGPNETICTACAAACRLLPPQESEPSSRAHMHARAVHAYRHVHKRPRARMREFARAHTHPTQNAQRTERSGNLCT
jgi:3-oxoacyl-[acyl-carrier-protein] synthase II